MSIKIAQSLALRMASLHGGARNYAAGWCSPRHHYYSWVVSAMQAMASYGNVHLYADDEAARLLVDTFGIPYDSVSICPEQAGLPTRVWVASKLQAFRRLVDAGEPFLHIDGDVFLFGRLPSSIENAAVVAQNPEDERCHPVYHMYTVAKRNLLTRLPKVPYSWLSVPTDYAYNMGLFGGQDMAAMAKYVEEAETVLYSPENAAAWRHIATLPEEQQWSFNYPIEQYALHAAAEAAGFRVTTLFDRETICSGGHERESSFLHALVDKRAKPAPGSLTYRLERRLENNWPEMKRRVDDWIGDQPSAPARDTAVSAAA